MKKNIYLIGIFILVSCSSNIYINKNYSLPEKDAFKVSILPVKHSINSYVIDSLFFDEYSDIFTVSSLRQKTINKENKKLNGIISKILEYDTKDKSNQGKSDLNDILKPEEYSFIKQNIKKVDFIIAPSHFSLNESSGSVFGRTTIRVYDFTSGKLIFEKKISINVSSSGLVRSGGLVSFSNIGKEADPSLKLEKYCSTLLASQSLKSIKMNLLNN